MTQQKDKMLRAHQQLRQTLRNIFPVFTTKKHNQQNDTGDKNTAAKQISDSKNITINFLRDIENCANAAREIGVCGQNKWGI